jgi:hypothetical protein
VRQEVADGHDAHEAQRHVIVPRAGGGRGVGVAVRVPEEDQRRHQRAQDHHGGDEAERAAFGWISGSGG